MTAERVVRGTSSEKRRMQRGGGRRWSALVAAAALVASALVVTIAATPAAAATVVRAYVANHGAGSVSVIDTATGSVITTITGVSSAYDLAVTPDGTRAYVTNASRGTVSVIDTVSNSVGATISVGSSPTGVAVTPDGNHVYVANQISNNVSVIDAASNTVTATIPVGANPFGVAVTPNGARAYVPNAGSNNVSVIDTASNAVTATIPVGVRPFRVVITPNGTRAYIPNAGSNNVSVIDTASNSVTGSIPVGARPHHVAVTPDGSRVYVTNQNSNNVSVINTATNTVAATIAVGDFPQHVAVTPNGSAAYVTNQGSDNVSVIDTSTNTVTTSVGVGSEPLGVAMATVTTVVPVVTSLSPPSGPAAGGTSVTITGTGFTGASAVRFGTIDAAGYTLTSSTQITAISPAGLGTVDVTVTTPAGTSSGGTADDFTYIPAVTVAGVIGNIPANAVYGNSFTATVSTNSNGATSVTSSTPTVCSVGTDQRTVSFVGAGTCTLTAHVAATTTFDAADGSPQSFAVSRAPTSTSLTASPDPSAPGQPVMLTATVSGSDGGGTVAFTANNNQVASCQPVPLSAGTATCSVPSSPEVFVATYSGTSNYGASTSNSVTLTQLTPLPVTVTGSQTYGGTPTFTTTQSLPAGVTLTGTVACSTVNGGVPIAATLTTGASTIDGSSCSGLTLGGPGAGNYRMSYVGGTFTVGKVTPVITWANPAATVYGTALGGTQLNATANVPGAFAYSPAAGSVLPAGAGQTLSVAFAPTDSVNYNNSAATVTITVTPASVPVTVTGSQTYGGLPTFTTSQSLPTGVTLTGAVACTTVNGGVPIGPSLGADTFTIDGSSCSGLSLGGPNAANYQTSYVGGTFTVGKATPVITWANPAALVYGTPLAGTQLNATANVPGAFAYSPAAGSVLPAGAGQTLSVTFTPTDSSDYNAAAATVTISVTPAPVPVTVTGSQTYGDAPTFTTAQSLPAGVTLNGALSCTTVNGGNPITLTLTAGGAYKLDAASCSGLSLGGPAAGSYELSLTGGTFTVGKATPAITWASPAGIVYGTPLGATQLNATANVPGAFAYAPPQGSVLPAGAGQALSVTFTPTDAVNFNNTAATVAITVTPAPVPVIVTGSQTYGDAPTFTTSQSLPAGATLNGVVSCTTVNGGNAITATLTTGGAYTLDPTSCIGLSLGGASAPNYELSPTGGTFTVLRAPTSTSLTSSPNPSAPGQAVTLTATVSGSDGGGAVAFTTAGSTVGDCGAVALDNGIAICSVVPFAGATFGAAYSGTTNYQASTSNSVTQKLFVPVTVGGVQVYNQTAPPAFTATPTVPVPEDVALGGPASCTTVNRGNPITRTLTAGGAYTLDVTNCSGLSLGGPAAGNYVLQITGGTFTVMKATPAVGWPSPASIVYGTALSDAQLNATADVPGAFDYTPAAGAVLHAGTRTLSVAFTPADTVNYNNATASVALQVTPAPLTVTANDATRYFGQPTPTFSVTYEGFVNGDTAASLSGALQITTTAAPASPPGAYVITATGLTSSDYTITYQAGALTVTKAPTFTTVTATPSNPKLNQAVTITATVGPNPANTGVSQPGGTVAFYIDGNATAYATVSLSAGGTASFVYAFGGGSHGIVGVYSGDPNYLTSTSTPATATVTCNQTITGTTDSVTAAAGLTCVFDADIRGAIVVKPGAYLDIENSTLRSAVTVHGPAAVRLCGNTIGGAVNVFDATGFVLIGDAANGCPANTVGGSLTLNGNTAGLVAIGNTYTGSVNARDNSGSGPLPGQTNPIVRDNIRT